MLLVLLLLVNTAFGQMAETILAQRFSPQSPKPPQPPQPPQPSTPSQSSKPSPEINNGARGTEGFAQPRGPCGSAAEAASRRKRGTNCVETNTSFNNRVPIAAPTLTAAETAQFRAVDQRLAADATSPDVLHAALLRASTPSDPSLSLSSLQAAAARVTDSLSDESALEIPAVMLSLEKLREFTELLQDGSSCPHAVTITCNISSNFRTADGSCNNLQIPIFGRSKTPLSRLQQARYQDGFNSPRTHHFFSGGVLPSARTISVAVHDVTSDLGSINTHLLMNLGQFIDHDLTLTPAMVGTYDGEPPQCCGTSIIGRPECFPITVTNDPVFTTNCINFARSAPTPNLLCTPDTRQQLDDITHYLDASNVYGSNPSDSLSLRTMSGGLLKSQTFNGEMNLPPRDSDPNQCRLSTCKFAAGDSRNSEQIGLTSIHTLFLRVHNKIAKILATKGTDEVIYQTTRKIVGGIWQHIVYNEFLPVVLGPELMDEWSLTPLSSGAFIDYSNLVNPSIMNEFAAAAFRFGHSLVRETHHTASNTFASTGSINVSQIFSAAPLIFSQGSNAFLRGQILDPMEKCDRHITDGLRNHLFNGQLDLAAFNIQRGRDHGLNSWNSYRESFTSLSPITDWDDLLNTHSLAARNALRSIYPTVNDMELFPAGVSEEPVPGGIVGSVFGNIIAMQFFRLKYGDRFYYETSDSNSGFTAVQRTELRKASLAMLYCWAAGVTSIKEKPLLIGSATKPCSSIPQVNILKF